MPLVPVIRCMLIEFTLLQATTSAVTAELVGVSSLLTYDIWKIYIRPKVHESYDAAHGHAAFNAQKLYASQVARIAVWTVHGATHGLIAKQSNSCQGASTVSC